jgi:LysR family hydrogen peroxide-inducible transcriptional activator
MNLRDLKYIIAVADQRHFGRAAEACCVSQPTLSGQVKKLEEQLGVTIFERTRRSVELTPIGEEIVAQARKVVEQSDALLQLAKRHQDPYAGPLRVGAIPTLSPYLMPLILRPLKARYPQMRPVLFEEPTEQLQLRLKKHEIDVALLATSVE